MSLNNFLSLSFVIIRRYRQVFSRDSFCLAAVVLSKFQYDHHVKSFSTNRIIMGSRSSKTQKRSKEPKSVKSTTGSQSAPQDDEYVEDVVCCESEIGENEMKVFDVKDAGKVLLVRQKGRIHALGTKCTHYGAPLVNSALGDGRVRCQWHGACFNIENGDIEDFPGLDSLPCHQVIIENCKVKVRAKRSALENNKRIKPMSKKLKDDNQHFVVLGGGPAGAVCVETLRQENFTGTITLICKENHLPYDRIKVDKVSNFEIEQHQFRTAQFYAENDIEVKKGVSANGIDVTTKEIHMENGEKLKYDKVFIATGSRANFTNLPGNNLKNIVTIRDAEDGQKFFSALTPDTNVVISGSSFIAMETAASCVDKVKSVTIVSRSKVPFQQSLGEKIGEAFLEFFKTKGVHFYTSTNIIEIKDDGAGNVGSIELDNGTTLDANILVLGIGATVNTDFLKNSTINLKTDGSIEVDEYLKTNVGDVYAGGDVAFAPVYSSKNQKAAIGHFSLAHLHGRVAALNMLGKKEKLKVVPYFFTMLFGKGVRYAGHGRFNDIIYSGDVNELKFVAFYIDNNDEVIAASSCGMDPIVSQFAELLYQGKKLYRQDIEKDPLAWIPRVLPTPVH